MNRDDEQRQLEHVRQELLAEFAATLSPTVVDAQVEALVSAFTTAPVRSFLPVLVRRGVRDKLRSLT